MTNNEETKPLTVDMKLDLILTRLAALEAKAYDTKPIWERALAEILEVKETLTLLQRRQRSQDARLDAFIEEIIEMKRDLQHPI
jgi:trans-2-enoyl-CoA reductase